MKFVTISLQSDEFNEIALLEIAETPSRMGARETENESFKPPDHNL